jgi:hypothetical protein
MDKGGQVRVRLQAATWIVVSENQIRIVMKIAITLNLSRIKI